MGTRRTSGGCISLPSLLLVHPFIYIHEDGRQEVNFVAAVYAACKA